MDKKYLHKLQRKYKNYPILNKSLELLIVSLPSHKIRHFSGGAKINMGKLQEQVMKYL
jgi:hypothetical protein